MGPKCGLLGLLLVTSASCVGPRTGAMKQRPSLELKPTTAPMAKVVFIRPTGLIGWAETPFLLERLGQRVLGEIPNGSAFAVELAPGAYQVCAAMPFFERSGWRYPFGDFEFSSYLRTPLTHFEVAAGKTYLFEVRIARGLMELVPARPGSLREARLLEEFPHLLSLERREDAPELLAEPADLAPWLELCVDSSPETRWRLGSEEGR